MRVLAPWSLSTYLPLNGFHPLYRSLASVSFRELRFTVPRTPGPDLVRHLGQYGLYHSRSFDLAAPDWAKNEDLFDSFASSSPEELWLQSNLSGDVELHHTAPATLGNRQFVLHCESFLPTFFPFFQQGVSPETSQVPKVRRFYRKLFESPNCRAIFSHIPETLSQFSSFFESEIIDRKLAHVPSGIDTAFIAKGKIEKPRNTINFVFLSSAHQIPASFRLRGGVPALKLALHLTAKRDDVRFYFRSARPDDKTLASWGIDLTNLHRCEQNHVVWLEDYLSDDMQARLLSISHFMILASANLHSVSIMAAMANGAVPIVTDTYGTDVYVKDRVNGIVLSGVKRELWSRDDSLRIEYDVHSRYSKIEAKITSDLISRLDEVLTHPEEIERMSVNSLHSVRERFSGEVFVGRLTEELLRRVFPGSESSSDRLASGERWLEEIAPNHFEGPCTPYMRLRLEKGSVFQVGKNYVFVPHARHLVRSQDWSLLKIAHEQWSPSSEVQAPAAVFPSLVEGIEFANNSLLRPPIKQFSRFSGRPLLRERMWLRLRPYPKVFRISRDLYHTLRRWHLVK